LLLIKSMPAKTPTHSKVVVLEANKMLIYNHYGAYEASFKAYEAIREYCKANKLKQNGPMREFYPANFSEPDTAKWLTRIMMPVIQEENKP
jgi:effector-binding domain-containing protein